jgi:hypothetical protein
MKTRFVSASASTFVLLAVIGCGGTDGAQSESSNSAISGGEAAVAAAPTPPDLTAAQQELDAFLRDNDVSSTKTYCRVDIATPECRNLIRFKNKATGAPAPGFMTTFTAPFRQVGGVEFFFPVTEADRTSSYKHFGDKLVDGKVIVEESTIKRVHESSRNVTIKDLKLGAIVADLTFNEDESVLDGTRPSPTDPTQTENVKIVYKRFRPAGH